MVYYNPHIYNWVVESPIYPKHPKTTRVLSLLKCPFSSIQEWQFYHSHIVIEFDDDDGNCLIVMMMMMMMMMMTTTTTATMMMMMMVCHMSGVICVNELPNSVRPPNRKINELTSACPYFWWMRILVLIPCIELGRVSFPHIKYIPNGGRIFHLNLK